jgi:eukaryotic-like serine/threonine-protein kinase
MAGEELVGRTIADGRYQIVRLLGEGGMGAVYQARQVAMDRMVALKLIQPEIVRSPAAAARFHREMKLTARIEHANTIRVYDFGETQGQLFLTMELLRGRTLTQVLAESGRLDLGRIVRIATQVTRALQAAHSEGVVHRDLKPDNVMLLDQYGEHDVVKVLDFGIAKSLDEQEPGMTTAGAIIGTPAYMSAEQAMGRPVDQRSDLYSLGIMLYEMASGRVPFTASAMTALLVAHASEPPPPLWQVAPDVAPGLAALVEELLRKDPAARPQTARLVEQRLEALVGAPVLPQVPMTVKVQPPPPPPRKSRGVWIALASTVLVGGGVTVAVLAGGGSQAPQPPIAGSGSAGSSVDSTDPRKPAPGVLARLAAARARLAEFGDPAPPDACPPAAAADAAELVLAARGAMKSDSAHALELADQALQSCPSLAAAHNLRGNALSSMRKLEDAGDAYARALQFAPDYEAPRFNLGVVQLRRRDPAAIATFTEILRRKPDDADALESRAQAYTYEKRYEEAAADLEQAVRHKTDDGRVWYLLGQLRDQLKQASAREAYCKAAELGIHDAAAFCKR